MPNVNPYVIDMIEHQKVMSLEIEICYTAEMDEFWSFVGKKSNQWWTWYATNKHSIIILAWHNGGRAGRYFLQLFQYLCDIPVNRYYTDDWGHIRGTSRWKNTASGKTVSGK